MLQRLRSRNPEFVCPTSAASFSRRNEIHGFVHEAVGFYRSFLVARLLFMTDGCLQLARRRTACLCVAGIGLHCFALIILLQLLITLRAIFSSAPLNYLACCKAALSPEICADWAFSISNLIGCLPIYRNGSDIFEDFGFKLGFD